MAKVKNSKKTYTIFCIACKTTHNINCNPDFFGPWTFSGTTSSPTFKPSCKIETKNSDGKLSICHFQIYGGEIEYMKDCTHQFKGLKIELPDIKM